MNGMIGEGKHLMWDCGYTKSDQPQHFKEVLTCVEQLFEAHFLEMGSSVMMPQIVSRSSDFWCSASWSWPTFLEIMACVGVIASPHTHNQE